MPTKGRKFMQKTLKSMFIGLYLVCARGETHTEE